MRKSKYDGGRMHNILRAMDEYDAAAREGRPRHTSDDPDEQRAQAAVGLAAKMLPFVRAGMSRTLALNLALRMRLRATLRDADGRICCSVCGEPFDAAYWDYWYPGRDRPDDCDLTCAGCAFGGEGA